MLSFYYVMCDIRFVPEEHVGYAKCSDRKVQKTRRMNFLGLPYNIAALALLTHMLAQQCDLIPHEIIVSLGDTHAYSNHEEQIATQLTRTPRQLPKLNIKRRPESIYDYRFEDFEIEGYNADPSIKAPVAV